MKTQGYALIKQGTPLKEYEYELKDPTENEVLVKISYCGVCHSDAHLIYGEWGENDLPLVAGHEVVGTVEQIGKGISQLKIGDRVGIGWQSNSCGYCHECIKGFENLCKSKEETCINRYGGFAEYVKVDARFAFKIPDAISSAQAAPLLCGGITVFNPLDYYNVKPYMRVGVIGMGGLGHLAVQYAHAFGCEVTVFSSDPKKEADAIRFGADHFIKGIPEKELTGSQDFIISTVHANLNWDRVMKILAPEGKLCFVGAVSKDIKVSVFSLISGQKIMCGGSTGNIHGIQQMLDFSARHNIHAQVEEMPIEKINEALEKVHNNKAHYRIVMKVS